MSKFTSSLTQVQHSTRTVRVPDPQLKEGKGQQLLGISSLLQQTEEVAWLNHDPKLESIPTKSLQFSLRCLKILNSYQSFH